MRTFIRLSLLTGMALASLLPLLADAPPIPTIPIKTTFVEMLAGKVVPLSLRLQDMTTGWSTFTSSSCSSPQMTVLIANINDPGQILPSIITTCYTRGETIELGGVAFLVIYKRSDATSRTLLLRAQQEQVDPLPLLVVTPETEVTLQLLDVRTIGDVSNIRLFTPQQIPQENARLEQARMQAKQQESLDELRQLISELQDDLQENNGKLPTFENLARPQQANSALDAELNDLVEVQVMPFQLGADSPYRYNLALSGKHATDFPHPSETIVAYEAKPWPDGKRGVAFLDGHAELVSEAEWTKLKEQVK